ncbi:metal-sulfur cluster assembly factor [Sphingobium algorifonticola]|nr:iron-sulfur cluster assembly protein [Sphingobium algorifonticola]
MLAEAIAAALDRVNDPCSIAAGRPLSVRRMGLVRAWRIEAGVLYVTFAVTFPGCTMAPHFMEAARTELLKIDGISAVETRLDTDYVWTPDVMVAPPVVMRGTPQAWRMTRAD